MAHFALAHLSAVSAFFSTALPLSSPDLDVLVPAKSDRDFSIRLGAPPFPLLAAQDKSQTRKNSIRTHCNGLDNVTPRADAQVKEGGKLACTPARGDVLESAGRANRPGVHLSREMDERFHYLNKPDAGHRVS
ncbi:hypothetical protein BJV77DRAFT_626764 [Russula vinacea]|nr:hypothetical protein BJV77DRAFT_626764 [Russula vinacea]